jgi:hypothetical protein
LRKYNFYKNIFTECPSFYQGIMKVGKGNKNSSFLLKKKKIIYFNLRNIVVNDLKVHIESIFTYINQSQGGP